MPVSDGLTVQPIGARINSDMLVRRGMIGNLSNQPGCNNSTPKQLVWRCACFRFWQTAEDELFVLYNVSEYMLKHHKENVSKLNN